MTILGETETLSVERSIGELRAGRPVLLSQGDAVSVVAAVETLDDAYLRKLENIASGPLRLVMTAARWRHLGLVVDRAAAVVLDMPPTTKRIGELVTAQSAQVSEPLSSPTAIELAAVDLVRLAMLLPAVVSVPVSSATRQKLAALCRVDAVAIETYRAARAARVRIVTETPVPLEMAPHSKFVVFRGGEGMRDQIAIVIGTRPGEPDPSKPVLVRLHSACLTGDLFGSLKCDCGDQLRGAMTHMAEHGGGVILYLDQEGRGNGISNKLRAYRLQAEGHDTFEADEILGFEMDQRRFEFAASMLKQLGFETITLLTNNPAKIAALQQSGLTVVGSQRLTGRLNTYNRSYLLAKRDRAGHLIDKTLLSASTKSGK
ncbi:GTP cyclohydrolase II RibA [Rhodoligotrophos defluvii]|uniref:GTP cyclohydrolase II RibA n=1 Tax=Rhodoligotrophos defluvii TaxID=2561934 RepID=UPI001EF07945|nr:GTP cyclohydrolase II RibA [Rhodoligotrophos defluvii]